MLYDKKIDPPYNPNVVSEGKYKKRKPKLMGAQGCH